MSLFVEWDNQRSLPAICTIGNQHAKAVTSGAIAIAMFLSIRAEIPSGPVDLLVSKLESSLMMSSSEHSRATGHSSGSTGSTSSSDKGVTEILKFVSKVVLRRSAIA